MRAVDSGRAWGWPMLRGSVLLLVVGAVLSAPLTAATVDETALRALEWREIGPYRGGRSAAVAGIPGERNVYYFGATGGGVWKTQDGGWSWKNVSDGTFGGSIGAVAVSEWDPNVVYVGGGEKTVRGNVSHGDGVWKSTDAGVSWTHVGLPDSRHIPRIRIHPRDPDLVYVAALGHLFGPNEERGIYRSRDGGGTWERILFVSPEVGAVDLEMDPTNPRILYASFWRVLRTPWSLESGGEGSGLWKSMDGGDSWVEITRNKGLPRGVIGISGISVSRSNSRNVYAIIEAQDGGVFRSGDGGETWEKVNEERNLRQRAWYYTRIYADPADEEIVYVLNVRFHRSKDGGKTFEAISTPHGDNHDLWIDPGDRLRMIEANDGGANVSTDGGRNWTPQDNQPTAQMYRVSVDNDIPYRLLGGQQDNSAVRIRSRSASGGAIGVRDWEPTAGGESGHIVAKPDDPDIVYGGSYGGFLIRFNHRTSERRAVNVWPDNPMGWGAADLPFRFQWNFPLFFSPHDPDTLYAAANVLFRTRTGGETWEALSPDLTRDDKSKMGPSGGPITKDNTSVEYYGTIFAALESPHEAGVLWTGSDDGLIHVSRDGGETWSDVTPPELPEWSLINGLEAHPTEPGGLYVAATRYKLDDFRPYLYRTTDWGRTWVKITSGIRQDHFTRAIRADPERPGLLYAGTESGIYVSFDDGSSWQSLQLNLPIVPITDLAIKGRDLVAATQGRGYWILDDLTTLHQLTAEATRGPLHLFSPRPTPRFSGGRDDDPGNQGTNPPDGVVFRYHLAEAPAAEEELRLDILDPQGELIRSFSRKPAEPEATDSTPSDGEAAADAAATEETEGPTADARRRVERLKELTGEDPAQLDAEEGLNRFVWNLRYPGVETFDGLVLWNSRLEGPRAIPGTYRARLSLGDETREVTFEVVADPRSSASPPDFREQFEFQMSLHAKLSEVHAAIRRLRDARGQAAGLRDRLRGVEGTEEIVAALDALEATSKAVEEALYQTRNQSRQDPLNFPIRLNDKLSGLMRLASVGDFRPTSQMEAVRERLFAAIDQELARLREIWETDLPKINQMVLDRQVPAIAPSD